MPISSAYSTVTTETAKPPPAPVSEERAFEDLYRAQYARLVVLARLMTGAMALAEEIVQDAFLQRYRNWSVVDYPVTYVRIAVVNGCRSHGRRSTLERRHRAAAQEPVVVDATAIAVRDAIQVLSARQRAAVVLRYFAISPNARSPRCSGVVRAPSSRCSLGAWRS